MMFLERSWCNLAWSDWAELDGGVEQLGTIPKAPGLYRVRVRGIDELAYIGQTGRSLRQRLRSLRRGIVAADMPFCDPHTAAPSLWAYRDAIGMSFEVSSVTVEPATSKQNREGLERFLIWKYRCEMGKSTLCNFGRTHPQYSRSKRRETGARGGRLPDGKANPAGGASLPPLKGIGVPNGVDWMGLTWSKTAPLNHGNFGIIPPLPGVYRVVDVGSREVVYFGQSNGERGGIRSRLRQHSRIEWGFEADFSYALASGFPREEIVSLSDNNLLEAESDLIGYFYELKGRAPKYQFSPLG